MVDIQNIQILRNFPVFFFTLGHLQVLTPIIITCTVVLVSIRNLMLCLSIVMFVAFFVLFVFTTLVQFSSSLVVHCSRTFVLLVRFFLLHIVYLASVLIFCASSWLPSVLSTCSLFSSYWCFVFSHYHLVSISLVSFAFAVLVSLSPVVILS